MTEYMCIRELSPSAAILMVSVAAAGALLTAGRTAMVTIDVEDGDDLRLISANLNHLKNTNYREAVAVDFGKGQRFKMDRSIWSEVASALLAYSIVQDCRKLGI